MEKVKKLRIISWLFDALTVSEDLLYYARCHGVCRPYFRLLRTAAVGPKQTLMRREYAILRFRHIRSFQRYVYIHSSILNHLNKERRLNSRDTFKIQREAALVEWQRRCVA